MGAFQGVSMNEAQPFESEVDVLIRTLREDPKIEAERQRNWEYWWLADRRRRDAIAETLSADLAPPERDMAYRARRPDQVGGAD
jgi:hypothetical protein